MRSMPSGENLVPRGNWLQRFPIYYGWVCVVVAAVAMTATLPGRTHGLSLITEPLLADLSLDRTVYSRINFVCTLAGAAFCLPIGWLIDRVGVRWMLTWVVTGLGCSVLVMSRVETLIPLGIALLFVRGFGQGALSVISMALVGKWFQRRAGTAMGVFAVLLTIGFIGSILGMGQAVEQSGWRGAWSGLGLVLLALVPLGWLLTRDTPESCGLMPDGSPPASQQTEEPPAALIEGGDFHWLEAVRSPVFWIFAAGTALFNLVWSAVTLFNESILAEQGFEATVAVQMLAALTGTGLIANLVAGAFATRTRLPNLLGIALTTLAISLACFPFVKTSTHLWIYGSAMGITGGIITVVFFSAWGQLFGRTHLGRIQGTAQILSILASASGPWLVAETHAVWQSYHPVYYGLGALTAVCAVAAFCSRMPQHTCSPAVATPELQLRPV